MADPLAPRRAAILNALHVAGQPMQIQEIVKQTGLDYNNARSAVSEMVAQKLLTRVSRGVYDLPERAQDIESPPVTNTRQLLNAILKVTMTNNALLEALFAGQQELLRAIRSLSADKISEDVVRNLEEVFQRRVDAHFETASRQLAQQYSELPPDALNVLEEPLARSHPPKENGTNEIANTERPDR